MYCPNRDLRSGSKLWIFTIKKTVSDLPKPHFSSTKFFFRLWQDCWRLEKYTIFHSDSWKNEVHTKNRRLRRGRSEPSDNLYVLTSVWNVWLNILRDSLMTRGVPNSPSPGPQTMKVDVFVIGHGRLPRRAPLRSPNWHYLGRKSVGRNTTDKTPGV